jgi:predicted AAA+ superfamily ATPase
VRLHPLSFSEYYSAVGGDRTDALNRYMRFGGMPFAVSRPDDAARETYLKSLFEEVYFKDIIERRKVERRDVLGLVTDFLCSSIGSLTNPTNIANSLKTNYDCNVSKNTVSAYLEHLEDSFLFLEARRYDIKGKSYFDYPSKFYCEDIGLRNARTDFRQMEVTHIMENMIYNELKVRGYSVDVGVVYSREVNKNGNSTRVAREIDFVVNKSSERIYVQSAYALPNETKRTNELKPFSLTGDSFRKIIVRNDVGLKWFDAHGVLNIGVQDFLLDKSIV